MNKKLFTSIDLTDFKKRFENSNDSNNKRYKEIVKKIVSDNEFPKDITFEEYRFIKKFLLLANKKSNTPKKEEEKKDEKDNVKDNVKDKKEETETNKTETNKTETKKKSYTKSNNSSITTKPKSSSKKTYKNDSEKV